MDTRTMRATVTFAHPCHTADYDGELPASDNDVIVGEDLLQSLSFEAYRRSATCLMISGQAGDRGPGEMRPIEPRDLDAALTRDQAHSE